MLQTLYIKDFALVDELRVFFSKGLNIITGETGAGKSILVNAIAQLCGERSNADFVRSGAPRAIIEAHFGIEARSEVRRLVKKLELEIEDFSDIIIRKEIMAGGKSRVFVNDSPVTLNILSQFSPHLLDLHGQHQHQRLLHPENHITYLDAFGDYASDLEKFQVLFAAYKKQMAELDQLKTKQLESFQKRDMYKYQFQELTKAELQEDELDKLRDELKILSNIEVLFQSGEKVSQALYSGEANAGSILSQAEDGLAQLENLDQKFSGLRENLQAARDTVEEIGRFTEQYLSELEFSPDRMEAIHQRIAQLEFLLKKYRQPNIEGLVALHKEMESLLNDTEQFDELIQSREKKILELVQEINLSGSDLFENRIVTASSFEQALSSLLAQVGMSQAKFRIQVTLLEKESAPFSCATKKVKADVTGFNRILFEIASNQGEQFKPIHKTASGGEISRLMLSLKSVLAEADQISTLVFDEIDTGISGKIAQIVGTKLQSLSQFHQILCVTHLPQIAAFGNTHLKVAKQVQNGRTFMQADVLNREQREQELANLLGGKELSEQALENARHLIREAQEV